MKKIMPIVVAFVCGILAFMLVGNNSPSAPSAPSNENQPRSEIQNMTVHEPDESTSQQIKSIKNDATQLAANPNYRWYVQAVIPVEKILEAYHGQPHNKDNWDHNVYTFQNGGEKALMIVCHGNHDGSQYQVSIGGSVRSDYVQAVEEMIAHWARTGSLQNAKFEQVVLTTCCSGYAPQRASMPIFGIDLNMINDNRNINAYKEFEQNGQLYVSILYGVPKSLQNSVTDLPKMDEATPEQMKGMNVLSSKAFAATSPFSDVPKAHWAYDAVTVLAAEGINQGYGDGTFLGNRNVTRYEAATMLAKLGARTFNVSSENTIKFSDIPPQHWAYSAVKTTTSTGICAGYTDGTFRGDNNITRYEMAKMIAQILTGGKFNLSGRTMPFSDVPSGHWAHDAVLTLAMEGINEGYGDGTFRGNQNITRYEAAMMLAKTLVKVSKR